MEAYMIYMPIALAVLGLIYMIIKQSWVMKQDAGDGKMNIFGFYLIDKSVCVCKDLFFMRYPVDYGATRVWLLYLY